MHGIVRNRHPKQQWWYLGRHSSSVHMVYLLQIRPSNTHAGTVQPGPDTLLTLTDCPTPKQPFRSSIKIDYVLCKQTTKPMIRDSRSYGGCDLNSDHKLVVTRLLLNRTCLAHRGCPKKPGPVKYDLYRLAGDASTQTAYRHSLRVKLEGTHIGRDNNDALSNVLKQMETSAPKTVRTRNSEIRKETRGAQIARYRQKAVASTEEGLIAAAGCFPLLQGQNTVMIYSKTLTSAIRSLLILNHNDSLEERCYRIGHDGST